MWMDSSIILTRNISYLLARMVKLETGFLFHLPGATQGRLVGARGNKSGNEMKRRRFTCLRRFISLPDLFPLAPPNRPWVSEDGAFSALLVNLRRFISFLSPQLTAPGSPRMKFLQEIGNELNPVLFACIATSNMARKVCTKLSSSFINLDIE